MMGGLPVFKGSRVPIDAVTASVRKGIPFEHIQAAFNFLNEKSMDAALAYLLASPERFLRIKLMDSHPTWELLERRTIRPGKD